MTIRIENQKGELSCCFLFGSGPANKELDRIECNVAQLRKGVRDDAALWETSKLISEELVRKDRTSDDNLRLIAAMQGESKILRKIQQQHVDRK